jgi:hypothetical protein
VNHEYYPHLLKYIEGYIMAEAEVGLTRLYGHVVTGTSGAIVSQDCDGFTVVKTASKTGRYTVNLSKKYQALRQCNVTIQGTDDSAHTISTALDFFLRQVDVNKDIPLFYIQFCDTNDPQIDAELEDDSQLYIEIILKNQNAVERSLDIPSSQDLSDILVDQMPDESESEKKIKETMYRLTEKLKDIFDYYENNIGDLQ